MPLGVIIILEFAEDRLGERLDFGWVQFAKVLNEGGMLSLVAPVTGVGGEAGGIILHFGAGLDLVGGILALFGQTINRVLGMIEMEMPEGFRGFEPFGNLLVAQLQAGGGKGLPREHRDPGGEVGAVAVEPVVQEELAGACGGIEAGRLLWVEGSQAFKAWEQLLLS